VFNALKSMPPKSKQSARRARPNASSISDDCNGIHPFLLLFAAMTRIARALGILPLTTRECEFNVTSEGTVRSVEFWPTVERLESDRLPIARQNAHLFNSLGRFVIDSEINNPSAAYMHELQCAIERMEAELIEITV